MGIVAGAVTIGALIGLGLRHGRALRPFSAAGRALIERLGGAMPATWAAALLGVAVYLLWVVVLGVCFTLVAAPLRGVRVLAAAVAFAGVAWLVSGRVIPAMLALTAGDVLGTAQRVFVWTLLALGLAVGMRLARLGGRAE